MVSGHFQDKLENIELHLDVTNLLPTLSVFVTCQILISLCVCKCVRNIWRGILPCTLHPHRYPSALGDRAYHQSRLCGGGRKSFPLLACSSAHRGSQLSQK